MNNTTAKRIIVYTSIFLVWMGIGALVLETPDQLAVGGPGTIRQLEQWRSTSTPYVGITTNTPGVDLYLPNSNATVTSLTATTICLTGDSCETSWPAGGGGGGSGLATTSIDSEAELESILTDVSNVFTNNDGTLADDDLSNNDTDDLGEGSSNFYYTIARVQTALAAGYNAIFGNATSTNLVVSGTLTADLTGNADTATALVANGGNCTAGSFPLGVDASGAVESCTDAWTEAENTSAAYLNAAAIDTSSELAAILGDETGTGNVVFSASPTLTGTPILPSTITLGANSFVRSGAHGLTLTTSGTTNVTLPTTGTLATRAGTETLTNKTITFANNTLTNVMSLTTAQSVTAGIKKTFQANGTNAGLRLAGVSSDPSSLTAGDIFYRTDTGLLKYRGASSALNLVTESLSQTLTNKTLTSPTLSTFFGTPCTGNQFLQDISDTGAFSCATAAGAASSLFTFNNAGNYLHPATTTSAIWAAAFHATSTTATSTIEKALRVGTATTSDLMNATLSIYSGFDDGTIIQNGVPGKPGCRVERDIDDGGYTWYWSLNGVQVASTTRHANCPN